MLKRLAGGDTDDEQDPLPKLSVIEPQGSKETHLTKEEDSGVKKGPDNTI